MATVPTPVGVTDGSVAHDSTLNVGLVTLPTFLLGPPMCQAWNSTGPSTTSGVLSGAIPFDQESFDNDGMHDTVTNNSRMLLNTLGWYQIDAYAGFTANATGGRYLMLRQNSAGSNSGGSFVAANNVGGSAISASTSSGPQLHIEFQNTIVGTYLEMFVEQNSTSTLTVAGGQWATGMTARWIHN